VSAAFSCHVFQHFNSREVAGAYFAEIYRVFSPGGSLMVHLPIYSWPNASVSFKVLFGVQSAISDFKAEVNRWMIGAGIFRPLMRRLVYQVDWLYAELGKIGFVGIELIMVSPRSSNDPHAFVLARKQRSGLSAIQAPADPAREYSPGQRLAA
jgi:hypothetical protein